MNDLLKKNQTTNHVSALSPHAASLRQLQQACRAYILHDHHAIDMKNFSAGRKKAEIGLNIYKDGYYLRLLEVLEDDYAALRSLLGQSVFERLMCCYIKENPQRSPYIACFGYELHNFLKQEPIEAQHLEMAIFERAFLNLWYTPIEPLLTEDHLQQIKPADWPTLHFNLQSTLQHISCRYPIPQWWERIVRENETIASDEQAASCSDQAHDWILWYAHGQSHYRQLSAADLIVLRAFQQGASFEAVCGSLLQVMDEKNMPTWIGGCLRRLVRDGCLSQLA